VAGEDQEEAHRERAVWQVGLRARRSDRGSLGDSRWEGSLATSLFNSFFINQLINLTNSSWIDEWGGRADRLLQMIQLTLETQPVEAEDLQEIHPSF